MKRAVLSFVVVATIATSAVFQFGCSKKAETSNETEDYFSDRTKVNDIPEGVYVAGWEMNAADKIVAKLWKNDEVLNVGNSIRPYSMYVSDDEDVYITLSDFWPSLLWKNGEVQRLNDRQQSGALSVFVSGRDVYVAGWENSDEYIGVAKLWKNGEVQNLSDGSKNAAAYSVYISGNEVYVGGFVVSEYNHPAAVIWKNGEIQNLTDGTCQSFVNSIFVLGDDVYAAGSLNEGRMAPKLWKNGELQEFENTVYGEAQSVYVSGNDVYVAGWEEEEYGWFYAQLWKNGVKQNISNKTVVSRANSVFVADENVFVAGWEADENRITTAARLWINGEIREISESSNSQAICVFVK